MVEQADPREARLRPEFAARYPYLTPGVWLPAAVLSDQVIAAILGQPRDHARVTADVVKMRAEIAVHKPPSGPFDIKHGPGGLIDFGVSHFVLEPGGISSQRHWHEQEDEFLVMIQGEAVLVEEDGETTLRAGDCAAFPKAISNGHHLVNRTARPCIFVVVGKPAESDCHYPDIDLHLVPGSGFVRKDGSPY